MKLKKLEVNAFGGINPNSPVVIDFTKSKWVKLEGDQGLGKTSLQKALLVACGQLSKDNKDFINLDSGKIDINLDFVGKDGYNYSVRVTKSSFILSYEGQSVPEPISMMKELLGVPAVSPLEIKYKPLMEVVKWLSGYSNKNPEEFEKKLNKFKLSIKSAREARSMANKSAKALTQYLTNEDLYINWEESEAKYIKPVDIKELSAKLDVAGRKSNKFVEAESKLKQLNERKTSIDEQIERLTQEAEQINKSITIGTKYIEENRGVKKEYDAIKKEYDNASAESIQYNKWLEVKRKSMEKDEFETLAQKADSQEKEILQSVKELQAEILPEIKGVELITEDTHEDGGVMKKEGLYWNGKNLAQLSESETWDLVLQIWRKYKVRVVIIDNYSNLGSMAVEILEKLSKDGAYILAAQTDRAKKQLEIIY